MSYTPNPTAERAGESRVITADERVAGLLGDILTQLQIMNVHLSEITDNDIDKTEVR